MRWQEKTWMLKQISYSHTARKPNEHQSFSFFFFNRQKYSSTSQTSKGTNVTIYATCKVLSKAELESSNIMTSPRSNRRGRGGGIWKPSERILKRVPQIPSFKKTDGEGQLLEWKPFLPTYQGWRQTHLKHKESLIAWININIRFTSSKSCDSYNFMLFFHWVAHRKNDSTSLKVVHKHHF